MNLRPTLTFGLLALAASGFGYPEFYETLAKRYAFAPDSAAGKAKCGVCHIGGKPPKVNPFGADVKKNLGEDFKLSESVLKQVASLDSDKDGVANEAELTAAKLPGEVDVVSAEPTVVAKSELIPKHSMHPALSHFPLALWAVAAFLEVLAKWKRRENLHEAAVINLGLGLVGAVVTIATGIAAMLRLGYWPLTAAPMIFHLGLMTFSTLVALAAWTQRSKTGNRFMLLLGLAAITVLVGGHFGGEMVYGS